MRVLERLPLTTWRWYPMIFFLQISVAIRTPRKSCTLSGRMERLSSWQRRSIFFRYVVPILLYYDTFLEFRIYPKHRGDKYIKAKKSNFWSNLPTLWSGIESIDTHKVRKMEYEYFLPLDLAMLLLSFPIHHFVYNPFLSHFRSRRSILVKCCPCSKNQNQWCMFDHQTGTYSHQFHRYF